MLVREAPIVLYNDLYWHALSKQANRSLETLTNLARVYELTRLQVSSPISERQWHFGFRTDSHHLATTPVLVQASSPRRVCSVPSNACPRLRAILAASCTERRRRGVRVRPSISCIYLTWHDARATSNRGTKSARASWRMAEGKVTTGGRTRSPRGYLARLG